MCYCEVCNKEVDFRTESHLTSLTVLGIPLQVELMDAYCKECGEPVYVEEIEKNNDKIVYAAYDEYCKKHGLVVKPRY